MCTILSTCLYLIPFKNKPGGGNSVHGQTLMTINSKAAWKN